jgi:hypothetical protein
MFIFKDLLLWLILEFKFKEAVEFKTLGAILMLLEIPIFEEPIGVEREMVALGIARAVLK